MFWVDSLCFILLPLIGWYMTLLSVYRLPAYYKRLKEGGYGAAAGMTAIVEGTEILIDFLILLFLVPVIIVCVHRIPHWLRNLRQHDYDTLIKEAKWWKITAREAAKSIDFRGAIGNDGFCGGFVIPTFTALFLFLLLSICYIIAVPTFLILMLLVSHRSVLLIIHFVRFFRNMPTSTRACFITPLKIVFTQCFYLTMDACMGLLPQIGFFVVLLSVYRMPVLVKKLHALAKNSSTDCAQQALQTALVPMVQGLMVCLDACVLVFLVVPIVLTIHRVPAYIRLLHSLGYGGVMHGTNFAKETWGEFKRIFTTVRIINGVFSVLAKFIAYVISAIILAFLVLTMSHRTIFYAYKIYLTPSNAVVIMLHGLMCFGMVLLDLLGFMGVPLLGWYLSWIFFWRVPAILYDSFKISKRHATTGSDGWSEHMELSFKPTVHLGRAILDILAVIGFVIPIFLTIHRIPYLLKRLWRVGYVNGVVNSKWHGIAFAEFKHILYCEPTKQEKIINDIVRAPVKKKRRKNTRKSERKPLRQKKMTSYV
eukprot:TRINITY_DN10263_c0_g1_i1.p1 TRINITY_DN10263_c0_g1~~TRINITY_DN10263_c0_g1_i1.p1  ORF type:complete len:537 (-),score=39.81 TRINITY_DN10263_c0_g1_i1:45-1655(-)